MKIKKVFDTFISRIKSESSEEPIKIEIFFDNRTKAFYCIAGFKNTTLEATLKIDKNEIKYIDEKCY